MINEIAIQVLENERECVTRQIPGCSHECMLCDLVLDDDVILAAYDLAIRTMRKELPKKIMRVRHITADNMEHIEYYCPNCFDFFEDFIPGYDQFPKRCESCGQVLDWSEVKV